MKSTDKKNLKENEKTEKEGSPKKKKDLVYRFVSYFASHEKAQWGLFIISFLESSVFAIPPDTLLIPMVLEEPKKLKRFSFICSLGSIIGAIVAYIIGSFLFYALAQPVLEFYHLMPKFNLFKAWYAGHGLIVIFLAGVTPFPFKLVTLASGAVHSPFFGFLVSVIIARSLRFFLVAYCARFFRRPLLNFLERWTTVAMIATAVIIALFVLYDIFF